LVNSFIQTQSELLNVQEYKAPLDTFAIAREAQLESSAADKLQIALKDKMSSVLIGVSGCGKTYAIGCLSCSRLCCYFTPLQMHLFLQQCRELRPKYNASAENEFRLKCLHLYSVLIVARLQILTLLESQGMSKIDLFRAQKDCQSIISLTNRVVEFISKHHMNLPESSFFDGLLVAIDEAQSLSVDPGLFCYSRSEDHTGKLLSFSRFFTWSAFYAARRTIVAGTGLGLADLERLFSGVLKSSDETADFHIFTEFDFFGLQMVKKVVNDVCTSRNLKLSADDFEERMLWLLQGRPRFLMTFLLMLCNRTDKNLKQMFDEFVDVACSRSDSMESIFHLWERLFNERGSVQLSLHGDSALKFVSPSQLALSLLCRAHCPRDDLESATPYSGSFLLWREELDTVRIGLFPVVNLRDHRYSFNEPLLVQAGLNYVATQPSLVEQCMRTQLELILDERATPQTRGIYFDVFIAMKLAWEASFRDTLIRMAQDQAPCHVKWIHQLKFSADIRKVVFNSTDDAVLKEFGNTEEESKQVLVPPFIAGPDVMSGPIVCGNKFSSTARRIKSSQSEKNAETTDPNYLYAFRKRRRFDLEELEDEATMMQPARKKLREEALEVYENLRACELGHVVVRFEWPSSNFAGGIRTIQTRLTQNFDVELDIDMETALKNGLLRADEYEILRSCVITESRDKKIHSSEAKEN
jgi:hypothetical protein